ncbi:magnesium transporter [Chitinispirillales bacterium ANBcel5]|uniref:magnesium transporter n=1 Tax=Cellulosispirillum alkaliphilum TaxID=3039283 RepID=UPI002A51F687|nr:magnesium transporter [Chitinispirillales bacterium ANBcel5]
MNREILHDKLREALEGKYLDEVKSLVNSLHPSVTKEALEGFSYEEISQLLKLFNPDKKADIFTYFELSEQVVLLDMMQEKEILDLVLHLRNDEIADLLVELPEDRHRAIFRKLAQKKREEILKLESYPEGTIGSIMTPNYAFVSPSITAAEALNKIRRESTDAEAIYYIYLVDSNSHLLGVVSLKQLIIAKSDKPVNTFMQKDIITLHAHSPVEEAVNELNKSDLLALPVLDREGRMAGIVTHDEIADAAAEETTEDFHRLAAAPGLKSQNLKLATIPELLAKRLPWLLILVFMNVFSGAGIAYFEDTIEAVVALVFFLPLLIDSGGNAGSQSATLMVRALAIGDVRLRDWFYFLRKEVSISILMGIAMGFGVSMVAMFRAPEVMVVVALTMLCTVVVGSLIGMMLPFVLTRLKLDPATASAPLITSLADISGVIIYFSIANWYLGLAG